MFSVPLTLQLQKTCTHETHQHLHSTYIFCLHERVYIYSDSRKAFGQVCLETSNPLSAFEDLQFSLWAVTFKEANSGTKKKY